MNRNKSQESAARFALPAATRSRLVALTLVTAACAIMSGCGGGSNTTGTSAPVAAPLTITTANLSAAMLNAPYTATLSASGGAAPYSFSIGSGNLPVGLTLSASGILSGSPSAGGTSSFTAKVTDSSATQRTASTTLSLSVYTATVQVNPATVLTTVASTAYGLHTSVYDAALSDVAGLPSVLATDGIAVLRYPGGVYADNYHWAQYSLTPFFSPVAPACGLVQNGYLAGKTDFGSFIKTLQATGTQAVITINYGTSLANTTGSHSAGSYSASDCSQPNTSGQPQEAAAWVAYANGSASSTQSIGQDAVGFDWKTVGFWAALRAASPLAVDDGYNFLRIGQATPVGITYWELGNEIFYNGWANNQNYETDLHAPYLYPNGVAQAFTSRSGISALSPAAYGANAVAFIRAMRSVDPAIKVGLVLSSPNVDPIPATWNPAAIAAVCAGTTFDFGILHYYPGTFNAVQISQLLGLPQTDLPALVSAVKTQIQTSCGSTAAVQFFMTETGPNGTYAAGVPSQTTGLFAANVYLSAFKAGFANVDWLELHNNFLTTGETPQPAYYGVQLAHLLAGAGDTLVSATSSSANLVSYASMKTNGQQGVLLLNADPVNPATVLVTIAGAGVTGAGMQYGYGLGTTPAGTSLTGTPVNITGGSFVLTVPALTATVAIFP